MYSAEQDLERFQAEAIARNRCDTPVKNLFLSGITRLYDVLQQIVSMVSSYALD